MRRNELAQFVAPEREAVVPELGGDGHVIVRTVPFGTKLAIARLPTDGQQACALAAATVSTLPLWSRPLLRLPWFPLTERTALRGLGQAVTRVVRWAMPTKPA